MDREISVYIGMDVENHALCRTGTWPRLESLGYLRKPGDTSRPSQPAV